MLVLVVRSEQSASSADASETRFAVMSAELHRIDDFFCP
jgi:hypothetical protein